MFCFAFEINILELKFISLVLSVNNPTLDNIKMKCFIERVLLLLLDKTQQKNKKIKLILFLYKCSP